MSTLIYVDVDSHKSAQQVFTVRPRRPFLRACVARGDATPWKLKASHSSDATNYGCVEAYEKGWTAVSERYDWAAARLTNSRATLKVAIAA